MNYMLILGALVTAGGAMGYMYVPSMVNNMIPKVINLKEGGQVYPTYVKPPFGMRSKYFVYEITNKKDFLNGAKPSLQVRGPFYYDTSIFKDNVVYGNNGETIKFDSHRKLVLDESTSENVDRKMNLINPILVGIQASIKVMVLDKLPFKRVTEPIVFNSVNLLLDQYKERLVMTRSARELLDGKKVDMLEFITNLAGQFGLKDMVPPGPPNNIFGIAYAQNETTDIMEIYAGVGSTQNKFADVISFNGQKSKVKAWQGECGRIEGTNGELYRPPIKPGKPIRVFLGPLCRSFTMDPVGSGEPIKMQSGVEGLQFQMSPHLFQGAKTWPANACFCESSRAFECKYDGLMRMGPCFFDAPLFFARPNFVNASSKLTNLLQADSIKFDQVPTKQTVVLEPITGTTLNVNFTFLAVFKAVRQPYMRDMAKLQNLTFVPIFATSESLDLPMNLQRPVKFLQMFYYNCKSIFTMVAIGGCCMILFALLASNNGSKPTSTSTTSSATNNNNNSSKTNKVHAIEEAKEVNSSEEPTQINSSNEL